MKRTRLVIAVFLAAAAAAAGPVPAPRPPLRMGPAPDLTLVFSSQVVGWIEPCG